MFRPLFLLTAAVAALAGCAAIPAPPETGAPPRAVFAVTAPNARSVAVVGTFNHWDRDRHRLSGPDAKGGWRIEIPLTPGRYEYLFLVDGAVWMRDPDAPSMEDGLGGRNSVLVVPPD